MLRVRSPSQQDRHYTIPQMSHGCPRISHGCPTGVHICHKDVPQMSHGCEAWWHPSVETQLLGGGGAGEGRGQFGKTD